MKNSLNEGNYNFFYIDNGKGKGLLSVIKKNVRGVMNPELPEEMIRQIEEVNQLNFDKLTEDVLPFVK